MKCNVCRKRFPVTKDNVYQVQEGMSLTAVLTTAPRTYDVIDCPRCSCQKRLAIRLPRVADQDEQEGGDEE